MNENFLQYGVAAVVTLLLLREVFGFIVKMRERNTTTTMTTSSVPCSFTAHQTEIVSNLKDIRDGINKLVLLSEKKR